MPLSYLVSLPSLECFGVSIPELVDVISKMEALSLSSDNKGVRISLPVARKTLIIRDTPEGTTEDTIRSLLPEFTIESIKEEIGRSWFVTLLSEEEASRAIALLQTMTIGGNDETDQHPDEALFQRASIRNGARAFEGAELENEDDGRVAGNQGRGPRIRLLLDRCESVPESEVRSRLAS